MPKLPVVKCLQRNRDMDYEFILGAVCGKCCRKNHRAVTRRSRSERKVKQCQ